MDAQAPMHTWIDKQDRTHVGKILQEVSSFTVIDCNHCGFAHVTPLPTADDLETIYSHEYYTQEKPFYIERYLEDRGWWDAVYTERYEKLEGFLGGRAGSILDVGSGPGLFLALGRERGWQVKGIEPSTKAAEYSVNTLRLDVENIFLDKSTAQSLGRFDVINMGEVLEHLPDPAEILRVAHGLLNPGGLLLLVVPNDFNPFQLILRDHLGFEPWWVAPPHHLNYFNHNSLASLVESVGFEVLENTSTFPIDLFLLMGKNYVTNDSLGRELHGLRKTFEKQLVDAGAAEIKRKLYAAFAGLGLGREVALIARRSRYENEGKGCR